MGDGPGFATKCARTVCKNAGVFPHLHNRQLYCRACAFEINQHALLRDKVDLFPTLQEGKPVKHNIRISSAIETYFQIIGCSCGWMIPKDTTDPDDAIAMHIATRGVLERPSLLPTPGLYRHYKGGVYNVIGLATIEATMTDAVVYVGSTGVWWVRPVDDFCAIVEHEGVKQPRFRRLGG